MSLFRTDEEVRRCLSEAFRYFDVSPGGLRFFDSEGAPVWMYLLSRLWGTDEGLFDALLTLEQEWE